MKESPKKTIREIELLFDVLALAPLLTLVAFYSYVLRARLILGHWPSPGNPPYPVGSRIHAYIAILGAFGLLPSAAIMAVAVVIWILLSGRGWVLSKPSVAKRLAVFLVLWIVCYTLLRLDPGRFFLWFWD